MPRISRRELARQVAAVSLSPALSRSAEAQAAGSKTRLILLGTAGGPCPRKTRVPSSQVVVVNGTAYVIDCGVGVATHLALADIRLSSGRVAAEARVKTLVLSHFVPPEDPEITDEMWTDAVRQGGYKGPVVLGKDLLEI